MQGTPYRPEIDGLRAISIFLVVAYHAHPWLIPGGFIGVDIFFVISGFLITRILLREMESGGFSITNFYGRRVRRIFPALIVVLVATYAMGWFILLPDQMQLLGENVAASVAFAANLFQISQAGYFAPDVAENPLLHLWSLGVEEQFYIFWPPALLLIVGSIRRSPWFGILAAVSFGVSLIGLFGHKDWAFYSPLARAWELLAGGILAGTHLSSRLSSRRFAIPENLASVSGLLAIFGSALALDNSSPFPAPYALLPVIGAVLMIASPNSLLNRYVLSSRLFVWFGLISYPLYLWHWPLLSYLSILRNGVPNFLEIWAAVAMAVILSAVTYRFVEIPLRKRPEMVPKLSAGLAAIGVMGIAAIVTSGFAVRFPPVLQDIARIRVEDNPGFADHCFSETAGASLDASCVEQGDRSLVFLWGDSTAAALYPALKDAEDRLGSFRLARFTLAGCAPILEVGLNTQCDADNRKVFGFVRSVRPDVVLLHAMWGTTTNLEKLAATIRELRASKVPRIVLLGPVPVWKRTLPHALINHYRFSHDLPERISAGMWGPEGDRMMESFSKGAGIEYISARQILCDEAGCLTRLGPSASDVVTTDMVHLSERGAKFLVAAIGRTLLPEPYGQLSIERKAPPQEAGKRVPN